MVTFTEGFCLKSVYISFLLKSEYYCPLTNIIWLDLHRMTFSFLYMIIKIFKDMHLKEIFTLCSVSSLSFNMHIRVLKNVHFILISQ